MGGCEEADESATPPERDQDFRGAGHRCRHPLRLEEGLAAGGAAGYDIPADLVFACDSILTGLGPPASMLAGTRLQGLNALASLLASAVVQSPSTHPDLLCLRASRLTISTDPPQQLVIDGEMLAANPVTFTCLPGALTVFAPLPPP